MCRRLRSTMQLACAAAALVVAAAGCSLIVGTKDVAYFDESNGPAPERVPGRATGDEIDPISPERREDGGSGVAGDDGPHDGGGETVGDFDAGRGFDASKRD
jgi:hypothetical protein